MHLSSPYALACAASLIALAFIVLIRSLQERRRLSAKTMLDADAEDSLGITLKPATEAGAGITGKIDQAFTNVVHEAGLEWTPPQAAALMGMVGAIVAGGLFLWRGDLWLLGLGLLLGMGLPLGLYLYLQARLRRQLQDQLPDVMFLLARSLRAGLSLEQSLTTVAQHGAQPLGGEFRHAVEQVKLGLNIPAALSGMAQRIRLTDFDILVTVVSLHRTMGGNLILLLDRVASSIRDRNSYRGYFRSATALGRISGFFISAAAPALFIGYALWQPEFASRFIRSPQGIQALLVALTLEIIGVVWLYWLLRVDY